MHRRYRYCAKSFASPYFFYLFFAGNFGKQDQRFLEMCADVVRKRCTHHGRECYGNLSVKVLRHV